MYPSTMEASRALSADLGLTSTYPWPPWPHSAGLGPSTPSVMLGPGLAPSQQRIWAAGPPQEPSLSLGVLPGEMEGVLIFPHIFVLS